MEMGLNQGEAKYFKKSSEGIMHSSNLYDDMQVFLLRRDSRLLLLLLLVEKQLEPLRGTYRGPVGHRIA